MKKLFVSVPMRGRTDEAIQNSIEKMHKMAELIFGEELEVIRNHCEHAVPDDAIDKSLYCLGYAIQKLAEADYFIGIQYDDFWRGCSIEASAAREYGIKSTFVQTRECSFLKDAFEIERKHWDEPCKCECKA